ncbi:hypothetical protein [Rhodococcus sp. Q]|uniref:hypothetical protein n=1 Tax=Rhodococcus sp. Q TaxID=2502252 RepID=UPI0010F4DE70|nr:hypothetical protein [Rhodococcus sp. Q]
MQATGPTNVNATVPGQGSGSPGSVINAIVPIASKAVPSSIGQNADAPSLVWTVTTTIAAMYTATMSFAHPVCMPRTSRMSRGVLADVTTPPPSAA